MLIPLFYLRKSATATEVTDLIDSDSDTEVILHY